MWLAGHGQDALPGAAHRIHHTRGGGHQTRDRDVHHAIVDQPSGESGVACHGTMHCILRQQHAIQSVTGVGRNRSKIMGISVMKIPSIHK
jgi:hypothetical protein